MRRMRTFLTQHRFKVIFGVPVAFAIMAHASLSPLSQNAISLSTPHTRYITDSDDITVVISIEARSPVNVAGSLVSYPSDKIDIVDISTEQTLVDLWAREPSFSNELGIVSFGGGILRRGGFTGTGTILSMRIHPKTTGTAPLRLEGTTLLAHDGRGTNVIETTRDMDIIIRKSGLPSPDIDGNGDVGIADLNTLYIASFKSYNAAYDMNGDGKVNLSDVGILMSLM